MSNQVGRNDPCPCGSGKKYKKCCLANDEALDNEPTGLSEEENDEWETIERAWAEHPEYERFRDTEELTKEGTNPRLHVIFHSIVERQLAANDPPETAEALKRLMKRGWDRHDAIHAIGAHVAKLIWATMKKKKPADNEAYRRELNKLGR